MLSDVQKYFKSCCGLSGSKDDAVEKTKTTGSPSVVSRYTNVSRIGNSTSYNPTPSATPDLSSRNEYVVPNPLQNSLRLTVDSPYSSSELGDTGNR